MRELLDAFHASAADLGSINRAHVVLLPKTVGTPTPGGFWLASLQNCRTLTTRLQTQILNLVAPDQFEFVTGRSIAENFVLATEVVQQCFARGAPPVVLKLDFAKAFDTIN